MGQSIASAVTVVFWEIIITDDGARITDGDREHGRLRFFETIEKSIVGRITDDGWRISDGDREVDFGAKVRGAK